jgi:hypothetical protein
MCLKITIQSTFITLDDAKERSSMLIPHSDQLIQLTAFIFLISGVCSLFSIFIPKFIQIVGVKVVLRHFHRSCYRSSSLWFFCEGMPFSLLVVSYRWTQWSQRFTWFELPEHNILRPRENWVVLLKHVRAWAFPFFDPLEVASTRALYSSKSDSYNELLRPDRWPRGR